MNILRRFLALILLVFVLSFGITVQKNQAAEQAIISSYLPMTLREGETELESMGPEGGSIVSMQIDPNDSNILYAGTWGSGMYKSLNGGASWQMINQGLGNLYINSLAIDPQNPAILYAGTYTSGVYKTTDGGATWAPTGPGLSEYPVVYTLAVDPVTPNVVYAGTRNKQAGPPWGGGFYKSTDGGGSWILSNQGLSEDWVYDIKIDPVTHDTVYAVTHSQGVFKSTNAGSHWDIISKGISDRSTRSLVVNPTNPRIMYVGTWHYGSVFKTINGGVTWDPARKGLNHKIYSLSIDQQNPNIIYAATYRRGIMVTDNGAALWQGSGLSPDMIYKVMIDPRQTNTLYAGTMGDGFYKSYDRGAYWISGNVGIRNTQITGLVAQWTAPLSGTLTITNTILDAVYTSVYGGGVYKTTDLGQTWSRLNSGLSELWVHALVMSPTDPQTLYAGTETAGLFITTNGGALWTASNNGLPTSAAEVIEDAWLNPYLRSDLFNQAFFAGDPDGQGTPDPADDDARSSSAGVDEVTAAMASILAVAVDSYNPQKVYIGTAGQGIYRSQNGGVRWYTSNMKSQTVYTILSDPFTPSVLYAGCDMASNALYRSQDGGVTWQIKNVGVAGLTVYALTADPVTPGIIYAGTSAGIYRSVDGAESWYPFGLSGQLVTAVGLYQSNPNTIFAGTSNGLFISNDGGGSWTPMNNGLVNPEITSLVLDPSVSPQIALIGTAAGGVYRYNTAGSPLSALPTSK